MNQKRHEELITDGVCSLFAGIGGITKKELKAGLRRYEAELLAKRKKVRRGVTEKSKSRKRTDRRNDHERDYRK